MPSKKKKYNARFPPARIKKIMQADEDVGKVAAAVPVIISRSLELFIDSLIERTASITRARNAKTLSTSHIKQAIYSEKTFDFLRDLVKAIPDHQVEEDGDGAVASGSGPQEKKPRIMKPRKPKEEGARGRGRPRKVKPEPEVKKESSSDNDDDDDEATETDEEQTSQEEMVTSDQASDSPAYNPTQASVQSSLMPPHSIQSRLDQPPCSLPTSQNPATMSQNSNVPPEQMSSSHFPQQLMTQRPFQPPQFPMQNYPYPQFVLSPGVPPHVMPPHFLPPGSSGMTTHQQPTLGSPLPPGMMPYPPFIPQHPAYSAAVDSPAGGPNGTQPGQFMSPGVGVVQQPANVEHSLRMPLGQAGKTSPQDSNMPIDMSRTGKSWQQTDSQSQERPHPDRPTVPQHTIPTPQGFPAMMPQGYSFSAQDQAQRALHSNKVSSDLRHPLSTGQIVDNHSEANKAINYSSSHSPKGGNSGQTESQKHNTADILRDTTLQKSDTQEKDKGLVSFPGLSNIMKINYQKPVKNSEDDDYDT